MTGFSLSDLEAIIDARANSDDLSSWTATLVSQGINKASEKLGEEAIESVVAAVAGSKDDLRNETADLLYHLLVVLHIRGLSLQEVMQELEVRSGQSGIAEKQSRSGSDNSE